MSAICFACASNERTYAYAYATERMLNARMHAGVAGKPRPCTPHYGPAVRVCGHLSEICKVACSGQCTAESRAWSGKNVQGSALIFLLKPDATASNVDTGHFTSRCSNGAQYHAGASGGRHDRIVRQEFLFRYRHGFFGVKISRRNSECCGPKQEYGAS